MTYNSIGRSLGVLVLFFCSLVSGKSQANPPDSFFVSIVESQGLGCQNVTDHQNGIICFDVNLFVNDSNWTLQSYNIWMDYGPDNTVLSYNSDLACLHQNGGNNNLDAYGKYRFFGANYSLELPINQLINFHNFCLDIEMFSELQNSSVTPAGTHYGLVSSANFVDKNNSQNAINVFFEFGEPFEMEQSSFLTIDPNGDAACDDPNLVLSSLPMDATGTGIADCEPFSFMWIGPDGFEAFVQNVTVPIDDPVTQSGLYELFVTGQNGCQGYESFVVDLTTCQAASCQDIMLIEGPLTITESHQARIEIIAQGGVQVQGELTFDAPTISLEPTFEVPIGVDFETLLTGCP